MKFVSSVNVSAKLLLLALLLLFSRALGTVFICTRFKGCVTEQALRAYCHQPQVSSDSKTVILQSPPSPLLFQVYGFYDITQSFTLYRNGTFAVETQPLRNVWCYVGFDVLGNGFGFDPANFSSVQQDPQADFGPLNPFVNNANGSSLFVPADPAFNAEAANGILKPDDSEGTDKGNPFGLCCQGCKRRSICCFGAGSAMPLLSTAMLMLSLGVLTYTLQLG